MFSAWGRVFAREAPIKLLTARQFAPASRSLATTATSITKRATPKAAAATRPKTAVPKKASTTTKKASATTTTKKDAAKKPVVKKAATKPVKQAAAKPKLTPEQKEEAKQEKQEAKQKDLIKTLREAALDPPTSRPVSSAWLTFVSEKYPAYKGQGKKLMTVISENKDAWRAEYEGLTSVQREALNVRAQKKKENGLNTLQEWVSSHTPAQIYEANKARLKLRRMRETLDPLPHGLKSNHFAHIPDERFPKRPRSAAVLYAMDRMAQMSEGGLGKVGMLIECMKGYKDLSEAERKKWADACAKDIARYHKEMKMIGIDIDASS